MNNPAEPTLADLLDLYKRDTMLSMNCHAIGIVQTFNPQKLVVRAKVAYKRVFEEKNDQGQIIEVLKDYPILMDCPVVILSGGKSALTFPITAGDECLILFNDRDLDSWWKSGQILEPATARLHSFSDAVALVGVRSLKRPIEDYDTTRVKLAHGQTMVGVGESKVKIANATTTLLTVLAELIDKLAAASTAPVSNGSPAVLSPDTITALNSVKTKLQGLLE